MSDEPGLPPIVMKAIGAAVVVAVVVWFIIPASFTGVCVLLHTGCTVPDQLWKSEGYSPHGQSFGSAGGLVSLGRQPDGTFKYAYNNHTWTLPPPQSGQKACVKNNVVGWCR